MSNINAQRRRSRSTSRAKYERIVLDQMPVAERKRLRAVSMLTRKEKKTKIESIKRYAVSMLPPSVKLGLAFSPVDDVPPKRNISARQRSTPLSSVPKQVMVVHSPTKARKPLSPLTCTPLSRYLFQNANQRQRQMRQGATDKECTRTIHDDGGTANSWFDFSKQRNAIREKRRAMRKESMTMPSSVSDTRKREDPHFKK